MTLAPVIVYADAKGDKATIAWVPPYVDEAIRKAQAERRAIPAHLEDDTEHLDGTKRGL